jgi:hypothetical protein
MANSSAFGESVDLLGSIRSILDNYPFSGGLLREILQNSDDAKATNQVRVAVLLVYLVRKLNQRYRFFS